MGLAKGLSIMETRWWRLAKSTASLREDGGERRGYPRHAARRDQSGFCIFKGRQLGVKGCMIGRVVQPDVFEVMVALLSSVLEHGRLENGHAHSPENAGIRLSRRS